MYTYFHYTKDILLCTIVILLHQGPTSVGIHNICCRIDSLCHKEVNVLFLLLKYFLSFKKKCFARITNCKNFLMFILRSCYFGKFIWVAAAMCWLISTMIFLLHIVRYLATFETTKCFRFYFILKQKIYFSK